MPPDIIDYRDPTKAKGNYKTYSYHDKSGRHWFKAPHTHLVLTKDGGVIVYYYGDNNTIDWKDLLNVLEHAKDPMQSEIFGIVVKGTGYLLERSRNFGNWSGDRNRYSSDLIGIVRALMERGVATASMPIWIGNWAAKAGEHIGTVGAILAKSETRQITLYHGTDSFRLSQIMQTGLKAMDFDNRVWNHTSIDKVRPAHREEAIYLTASRPQAEYYAKKAVNVDRKRFGPSKRYEAERLVQNAQRQIGIMTGQLASYDRMSDEQIASHDAHDKRYSHYPMTIANKRRYYPEQIATTQAAIDKAQRLSNAAFYDKIEPVILQVTLYKRDFDKLMADDDHLRRNPEARPDDWQTSLSHFGQIAFKGMIPPNRIKVIAKGRTAGRISS